MRGAELQATREQQGFTRAQLTAVTRIPEAYIAAIEEDRLEEIPVGPYAEGYRRLLHQHLGLPPPEPVARELTPPRGSGGPSLPLLRSLALLGVVGLLVMVISAWVREVGPGEPIAEPASSKQTLRLIAHRNTRIRVAVDGGQAIDREVASKEVLDYQAERSIEVDLKAVDDVRVFWNGELIQPQGQQRAPRRLVFVDDVAEPALGGVDR